MAPLLHTIPPAVAQTHGKFLGSAVAWAEEEENNIIISCQNHIRKEEEDRMSILHL